MINPMNLIGKKIIVTGASSGLGRQVCITLSQLGAEIVLISRNEDKLKETLSLMESNNHHIYPFDLSQIDDIEKLIGNIITENGKLDGFVHCAGIGTVMPLTLSKPKFIDNMIRTNLTSFVEISRVLSKKRNLNEGSSIVAISSAASKMADKGKVGYCLTKGALDSVVRAMAIELGSRKIRVNTINPGWIKTDMYYGFIEEFGEERMNEILTSHILGAAEPQEVSNVIAFLLSHASSKITGQNIFVDSGWSING